MYDAFEDYGNFFMVLELCNSRSLLNIINKEHRKSVVVEKFSAELTVLCNWPTFKTTQ